MTDLAPIAPKIGRLVRMLDSENDGEALASARALGRVLKGAGATMHDLADLIERPVGNVVQLRPAWGWEEAKAAARTQQSAKGWTDSSPVQPRWAALNEADRLAWVAKATLAFGTLDRWQASFAVSILEQLQDGRSLTDRQIASVDSILARLWAKGVRV